jgi:hypothetical protein
MYPSTCCPVTESTVKSIIKYTKTGIDLEEAGRGEPAY